MILDRQRSRLPLTSHAWFFPALILLTPLFARVCVSSPPRPPERRPAVTQAEADLCFEQYQQCLDRCSTSPPPDSNLPETCEQQCSLTWERCLGDDAGTYEDPACDPDAVTCELDDAYADDSTDWSCESEDSYDDSSSETDWSCGSSDDYSDEGGLDCTADNYDDGDYEDDWGEDWGERSPAGGDGIAPPDPSELPDLPDLPQG